MGVSDRCHFAWLREALGQFEAESGWFESDRHGSGPREVWCMGSQRVDPATQWLRDSLGRDRTRVVLFDKFPARPDVREQDLNALDSLPDDACDLLVVFRASCFVADPPTFLHHARRVLRPGGLAVMDWLHGWSRAPVLDMPGGPRYGGQTAPFLTTYMDAHFLAEFPEEFRRFLRHVNGPPWWVNVEQPGVPLRLGQRLRRLLAPGPRRSITPATYVETLRTELARAGKHLIEPGLLEQYFKVVFRHARYFFPRVRKFNLYLLTVLQPVEK
jgi:SAM-dependent methyltransferase